MITIGVTLLGAFLWLILKHLHLNQALDRIVGAIVIVGGLSAFLIWLFPDMSFGLKVAFALPLLLFILVAIVWPAKKGWVWPRETRITRPLVRGQRLALGLCAFVVFYSTLITYSLLFPVPAYLQFRTNYPQIVEALTVNAYVIFLVMFRHHVRSLPPKKKLKLL